MKSDIRSSLHWIPTHLESIQDRLAWQEAELAILQQVRSALTDTGNVIEIITSTVNALVDLLGYGHVGAYLVHDGELHLVHPVGFVYPMQRLKLSAGICGRVATTGKAVHLSNVNADPGYLAANDGIESEICVPFGALGETRGVLNIESTRRAPLSDRDFKLTQEVGDLLSLALERAELANANVSVERRLQAALDAASMGAWIWTIPTDNWHWTFGERTNEPVRVLEGVSSTAELRQLIHAGDVAFVDHAIHLMIETGDLDVDFRLSIERGAPIWLNLRGHAIEWASRETPVQIAGVVTDVSGRKRLEEERIRLAHHETARINAEEARLVMETTIERLTDGFISTDPELKVTLINEPAAELVGRDRISMLDMSLIEVTEGFSDERGRKQLLESALAPLPSTFDLYDPGPGRFIDVHIYPGSGGVTIYLRDVTRLRQAEFERHQFEARFRSLVQQASDLTVVLDRRGMVTFCSPAIERILGYKPNEVLDRVPTDLIYPADIKRLRLAFVRLARHHGTGNPLELRLIHRDGSIRWIEITPTNLLADGSVKGIVANCRDVTDRHTSEFQMWLMAEVASVIGTSLEIETMLDGMNRLLTTYLFDCAAVSIESDESELRHFRIAWKLGTPVDGGDDSVVGPGLVDLVQANRRLGIVAAEASSIQIEQFLGAMDPGPIGPLLEALAARGIRTVCPAPIVIMGGLRGAILVGSTRDNPFSLGEIALVHDIARRAGLALANAELYEKAQEAIATRDRFLSIAAHELRTPITSVTGYTEMLGKEIQNKKDPARIERYVGRLADAGTRLASLAEDLLDVSRLRGDMLTLRSAPVDLTQELQRLIYGYRERGQFWPERIQFTATGESQLIDGDSERLEQVCSNLIGNALKYSGQESPIEIKLHYSDNQAELWVTDHGIGVDSASMASIFQPFGRAQNAVDSDVPGLGLGLYIARSIIEAHAGTITASSSGPGTGLSVALTIPYQH